MELKAIKNMVEQLLRENMIFRGDDDLLYFEICQKIKPNVKDLSACEFFLMRKKYGLPSFESVRRSRAKIMEEHPELKPCEKVQKGREEQRERFYKMATNQGEFAF